MTDHATTDPPSTDPPTTVHTIVTRSNEATVIVDGVRVRWRVSNATKPPRPSWLCDECGRDPAPLCVHVAHSAASIASTLLGLPADVTTTTPKETHP